MAERFFLVVWGGFMLIALYRVATGRDRDRENQHYRRAYGVAMEQYLTARFGRPDWSSGGRWVLAIGILLVLFSLFLVWVGSFG